MDRPPKSKGSVLVVDDDPIQGKTLADILMVKGYETIVAKNGTEGLALLCEHAVNLALVDLGLPDISGLEVLDRIKSAYPNMEVIILTGNATLYSAIEATNHGALFYLVKPYEIDQLLLHIRRAVEKQQTEQALQSERQRLFSVLENLPGFVCLQAPDHSIPFANRYFRECFGEVGGRLCYQIFQGREEPCEVCPTHQVFEDRELKVWEWDSKDNRTYQVYDYPFIDIDGSPLVLEFGVDISEQKCAERELKATQAQILQSEKMASIGQLAAGVAHEINNPIGFVSSNLNTLDKYVTKMADFFSFQEEKLQSTILPEILREIEERKKRLKLDYIMEDARNLIRESLEGTDRVRKIVQDLKTFSRLDEVEFKRADINECLESTINIVWNEIKYKATLRKELGDLPPIKCYPQQLNQVFLNLLVNASHALDSQGEITLRTWSDAGFIHVSVADTGCGIPEEIQRRIFEPFFTTKEVGKGTGLGLSISYDIVKKHNGDINMQSTVGKGTTFTVRLPVVA